jgi:hypothetical protein
MVDVATPATYTRYTNNWNSGVDSMRWGTDISWGTNGTLIVNPSSPAPYIETAMKFYDSTLHLDLYNRFSSLENLRSYI